MLKILVLFLLTVSFQSFGHPVIYKEGFVLSSSNMANYSDNHVLYSLDSRWAVGLNHWRFTRGEENSEFAFARINRLLTRFNGPDSQANIYLLSGFGVVDSEIGKKATKGAYLAGIEADWETRTLYTSLKHLQFSSPEVTDLNMTRLRVGLSPATAKFDQLQTWFMVQGMYMGNVDEKISITPMLRFFYHNVLWEIGSSTRGEWMLNLMVHL